MDWILILGFWIRDIVKGEPELNAFDHTISRDTLVTRGRILIIDDDSPPLLPLLKKQGFSITHDRTGKSTSEIERHRYDLIILDYGNVGKEYGKQEGLSLLRQIKRVSPATYILAFTSLSLSAGQSDFYKLSDGVLNKDAGLQEASEIIESGLRESFQIERHLNAILKITGIEPGTSGASHLKRELIKTIRTHKSQYFKKAISSLVDRSSEECVAIGLEKLLSIIHAQ